MIHGFQGFAAPPARQANDRLAGNPAAAGWDGADSNGAADLPLTAFFRRHADAVTVSAIAAALAGAAAFGLPFLLAR